MKGFSCCGRRDDGNKSDPATLLEKELRFIRIRILDFENQCQQDEHAANGCAKRNEQALGKHYLERIVEHRAEIARLKERKNMLFKLKQTLQDAHDNAARVRLLEQISAALNAVQPSDVRETVVDFRLAAAQTERTHGTLENVVAMQDNLRAPLLEAPDLELPPAPLEIYLGDGSSKKVALTE